MLQMIGGDSAEIRRQHSAAGAAELVGMDAEAKPQAPRRFENAPGGLLIEDVRFAEDIAEAGQLLQSYQGKHLLDHQVDVSAGTAKKLVRHFMRAEKGRHAAQGRRSARFGAPRAGSSSPLRR